MNLDHEFSSLLTRRHFFGRLAAGIGTTALASVINPALFANEIGASQMSLGSLKSLQFPPRAKRVIYLFMSGGPSHIDLFDYKPKLREYHGTELPASIRMGQRVTGMTSGQKSFPCVAPMFEFHQYGKSGAWVSELLPNLGAMADELAI